MGKIIVVLYSDITPITVRNFTELIQNYSRQCLADRTMEPKTYPHYTGTPVHRFVDTNPWLALKLICNVFGDRICPGLYIEMGDNTKHNGMGGVSSFGADFPQENFILEAKMPGMLAMIPDVEGNVNSKFLITTKRLKVLNGKRTVVRTIAYGI